MDTTNNVKLLKFPNGEEIMVNIKEETDETFTFDDALALALVPSQEREIKLQFIPWVPYAKDGKFTIHKDKLIFWIETTPEMTKRYKNACTQIFSSLVVPQKPQLIIEK